MSDPRPPEHSQDWQSERREGDYRHGDEYRHPPRAYRGWGGPWIGGVVLIALGLIFLLRNLGVPFLQNWWALIFLIPAGAAFFTAWRTYQRNGNRLSGSVVSSVIIGAIFLVLAITFLMSLEWGIYWPVILVLLGIAVLAAAYWRR